MSRHAEIVLLCEDKQHAVFGRRFLEKTGYRRPIRVLKASGGEGSAAQWVTEQFAQEVKVHREGAASGSMLLVLLDDDTKGRRAQLERVCADHKIPFQKAGDRIGVFVPKRNIETWLLYLDGQEVDETKPYKNRKLKREKDCYRHVEVLLRMCQDRQLRQPCPTSLSEACDEFARVQRR